MKKIKRSLSYATALMLVAGSALADETAGIWNSHFSSRATGEKYTSRELSLDLFGSYINAEGKLNDLFKTNIRKGFWGGGVGLNYFLTKNLGLETDVNMSDHPGRIVDQWVGNLVLRLPLGNSGLAPYAIGGGGRSVSPTWDWVYGGGVGLEYRWSPKMGLFSDARFMWNHEATDLNRLLIRFGVRIAF